MKNKNKALVMIILSAIAGSSTAVFSKITLKEISPVNFTFLRFGLALATTLPVYLAKKHKLTKSFLVVLLISLFSTINIFLFTNGIRLTSAIVSQIIYTFVPVATAINAYFLLKEKLGLKKIIGILMGLMGTMLIVLLPTIEKNGLQGSSVLGNVLILLGAISYSFYPIASKKIQNKFSPLEITLGFLLTTTCAALLFWLPNLSNNLNSLRTMSLAGWMGVVMTGVFGTTVFYLLVQKAIKLGSALTGTLSLYMSPFLAVIWAWFLLGERLSIGIVIGGLVAITGAYLTNKS